LQSASFFVILPVVIITNLNILKQNFINYIILSLGLGLLLMSGFLGWQKARAKQASIIVLKNFSALKTGLEYFFNDYERFPKNTEFESLIFMQDYFSARLFCYTTCSNNHKFKYFETKFYQLYYFKFGSGFVADEWFFRLAESSS
jgi:hypothetical protein